MNLLERLWAVADEAAAASGKPVNEFFGWVGLSLQRPLTRWNYFCTPLNTVTFASTGGDGVHYGFLQLPELPVDELPVVMTMPMGGDQHNTVVAEALEEFLNLGYYVGWFSLEQLVYYPENAVNYFNQPDPDTSYEEQNELDIIKYGLSLSHTPLSIQRINELGARYLSLLQIPEFPNFE